MHLRQLHIRQFKNHTHRVFDFNESVIGFTGSNGIGKTNLLDAIHYLCLTKSYFIAQDTQNIQEGCDFFVLEGYFDAGTEQSKLLIKQPARGKKEVSRNNMVYEKLAEHIGRFPVVMITPYDVDLIQEGSEVRRKFLDTAISQLDQTYLTQLMQYQKVVAQRNVLLKQLAERNGADKALLAVLDTYDAQLLQYGEPIIAKRQAFLPELSAHFEQYYQLISGNAEAVRLTYVSGVQNRDFATALVQTRQADIAAQRSLVGCHRDDLEFSLRSLSLKKFGSQGQQKSFLLALKFAQWKITATHTGKKALLLLDDLFDRMDENRIRNLVALFPEFGQLFISDTHQERLAALLNEAGLKYELYRL